MSELAPDSTPPLSIMCQGRIAPLALFLALIVGSLRLGLASPASFIWSLAVLALTLVRVDGRAVWRRALARLLRPEQPVRDPLPMP